MDATQQNYKELKNMVEEYRILMIKEQGEMLVANNARMAVEYEISRILVDAYACGVIDGKNEAARKLQENALLECSNSLYWLKDYQIKRDLSLALVTVDRKASETWISIMKAWLYSQAKVG